MMTDCPLHQWNSMDTAPKDGTKILAVDASEPHRLIYIIEWDGWWRIFMDGQSFYPTHWMSLPEPPR